MYCICRDRSSFAMIVVVVHVEVVVDRLRICMSDTDCTGGLTCQTVLNSHTLNALLKLWRALDSSYDLSACGGADSILTKIFTELASMFKWAGPAGGLPASVSSVSLCQLTPTQVQRPVALLSACATCHTCCAFVFTACGHRNERWRVPDPDAQGHLNTSCKLHCCGL